MNERDKGGVPSQHQQSEDEAAVLRREMAEHVADLNRLRADVDNILRNLFTSGPNSYVNRLRLRDDDTNQRVQVQDNGTNVGDPRPIINIIGATSIVEDPDENRIDITL